MKINNYDMSSTGVNIELYHRYDYDESRWRWEENFETLKQWRQGGVYLYTPYHEIEAPEDWRELVKIPEGVNNYRIAREIYNDRGYEVEGANKREKVWNYLYALLDDYFDEGWWDEEGRFWKLVAEFDWKPVRNFEVYGTRGYCQGDYAEVVIFWDDLKRLWGGEPNKARVKEEIDHLFWDCPYWGRVEINGVEYYIDEYVEDEYEVGEDEVKGILMRIAEETGDKKVVKAMEKFIRTYNLEPQYIG